MNTPISQTLYRVVSKQGEPIGLADFDDMRKAFKTGLACSNKGKVPLTLLKIEQVTYYVKTIYPEGY